MQETERYPGFQSALNERGLNKQFRTLTHIDGKQSGHKILIDGKEYLNFCSNDYLGLSSHSDLIARATDYVRSFGTSASASRLVSGSLQIHRHLEERLASICNREAALLFGSGFQANVTLLPAIANRGDLILADKEVHNSIIQGGTLSRAEFRRFRHNDTEHLVELLERANKQSFKQIWVVTESLFSMDGDLAPIDEIARICKKFKACLYVDEAHAFGVYGKNGSGLSSDINGVDITVATLGKAAGGFGGFVATSSVLKDWLINYCTGFIYSTALPPAVIGAAEAALDLIPFMDKERFRLQQMGKKTKERLLSVGYYTGASSSQIIPVLLDSEASALELSEQLFDKQIFIQAIRPPTVRQSRLRVTLTATHTESDINRLIDTLQHHGKHHD